MTTSKPFHRFVIPGYLAILSAPGYAQRPFEASVCDHYAQKLYGANNSNTQLRFVQNVVSLAFEGGSSLDNVSSEATGILRPGTFKDMDVDLLGYFNGSKSSTNVNNAPIGINWLDQGGTDPLATFLAGNAEGLDLEEGSNQYHLFGNFFVSFSHAFGCTLPPLPPPNTSGPVSLAYAHKFMQLGYHQVGYFIDQLSLAAAHFGVSIQDVDTFRTSLNSRFNLRCAPAVPLGNSSPPELLSICQNPTCPLAVPVSDCAAYENITADGIVDSDPTTISSLLAPTAGPSDTETAAPPSAGAESADSGGLSTGGIVGAAIGGAAVLLIAGIAILYFLRKRKPPPPAEPESTPPAGWNNQDYGSPTTYHSSTYTPKAHNALHYPKIHSPSEMHTCSPIASPDSMAHQGYWSYPNQNAGGWRPAPAPVELDDALRHHEVDAMPQSPQTTALPGERGQSDNTSVQGKPDNA
ncbi:hypothetical protein DDE83_003178 [Stemphylium lycopersici]|uniref:Uncharacterized protein n=1 Tax=Stemphylium lycopersici TaxID=183478 RepID=A0A364N8A1_STELY|nr:hypothetical protein DDE83_003178 [Stemphylium lycopersici]